MRILVTGAAGFVGSRLIVDLAAAGHQVIGQYRTKRPPAINGVTLVQQDLSQTLTDLPVADAIIHTAVQNLHFDGTKARDFVSANVVGALNLADYAERCGAKFVLNFSSISAYGNIQHSVLTEAAPLWSPELYGTSKYLAELIFQEKFVPGLSIRLPGIVGPGTFSPWLGKVLRKALDNQSIGIFRPDAPFNNVVSVEELCRFARFCLDRNWDGFHMVNMGASEPSTIRGVVEAIIATVGSSSTIQVNDSNATPFAIAIDKLVALGFTPMATLDQVRRYAGACAKD